MASEHGRVLEWPGVQRQADSDGMDLLHGSKAEYPRRQEALERMHVISLGSFCGVKLSIQRLGLGSAHLPLDWVRSTTAGVLHFLRSDFDGFFSVASQSEVGNMRVFRSERHSFWHDDISNATVRAKLQRRIQRFLAMREDPKDLLFVRSCDSTDTLPEVETLYAELCARFGDGRRVLLLVIVDGQDHFEGPIQHEALPGVMFFAQYGVSQKQGERDDSDSQVYTKAISFAVEAALNSQTSSAGFGLADSGIPSAFSGATLIGKETGRCGPPQLKKFDAALYSGYSGLMSFEKLGAPHFNLCSAAVGA
jgi:hypothetical protein